MSETVEGGKRTRGDRTGPRSKFPSQEVVDIIMRMHKMHNLSPRQIADYVGRSKSNIHAILQRCDPVTGIQPPPGIKQGRPPKSSKENDLRLREIALASPFISLRGLTQLYNKTTDQKLSVSSVFRRLEVVGIRTVNIPADSDSLRDKKKFPKSQFVRKFEEIPVKTKKKQNSRKKKTDREAASLQNAGELTSGISYPTMAIPLPSSIVPPEEEEGKIKEDMVILAFPVGKAPVQLLPL